MSCRICSTYPTFHHWGQTFAQGNLSTKSRAHCLDLHPAAGNKSAGQRVHWLSGCLHHPLSTWSPVRREGSNQFWVKTHKIRKGNSRTFRYCVGPRESSTEEDIRKKGHHNGLGQLQGRSRCQTHSSRGNGQPYSSDCFPVSQSLSRMGPQVLTPRRSLV